MINEIMDDFSPVIRFTAVSVPNAHLIGAVTKHYIQSDTHQCQLAQYLNKKNPICHDGVNVSYMYPVQSNSIYVRTYERGVGFTNACGTAMTAAALVAKMTALVTSEEIIVYNPGGFVKCTVNNDGNNYEFLLTGNATITEYCLLQLNEEKYQWIICEQTTESIQYEKCIKFVKEHTAQFIM
ncbi:hypothetical protein [Solibacillus sp. CAU 1738]|uniref:hypothetical protein n=1 Tax=Solibacillus sp. CAU 1738 TaxID=3140363 RepID=UPI003260B333